MARPLRPYPSPSSLMPIGTFFTQKNLKKRSFFLNGLAFSRRTFFAACLAEDCKIDRVRIDPQEEGSESHPRPGPSPTNIWIRLFKEKFRWDFRYYESGSGLNKCGSEFVQTNIPKYDRNWNLNVSIQIYYFYV